MIKAFIFDLDGVLVHTDYFHFLAWKKIAEKLGIPFDEQKNNLLRGVSRRESLEIILNEKKDIMLSEDEKNQLLEEKNFYYKNYISQMSETDASVEVTTTLENLKKEGFLLAVGSSSKNAQCILEKTQLRKYFEAVSDGNNISKSKPDPEVFVKAAHFLSVKPEECAVVEDAVSGINAAINANMLGIGIGEAACHKETQIKIRTIEDLNIVSQVLNIQQSQLINSVKS